MIVNVDEPPAVTEVGLRDAVAPAGIPLTLRATVSADPDTTAVEIVEVPELPSCRDTEVGLALMLKLFVTGAVMVSDTEVVCVAEAAVPVTVKL